ncbi:galectin-6-like isoform X1 [Mauremys reevesii]|uniref:galectin-6-like isoform X1 n=1 Tax=Mauremys reevesii TaxID=260615 RepID=UPI00193F68A9|nr:galectin-6-like isoform X1 [Mauremys reevesii]
MTAPMTLVSVTNLETPCNIAVAGGFLLGMLVNIRGSLPKDSQRFDVNFLCGGDRKNEVAFHFKALFSENKDGIVFNSKLNKEWGQEEERCSSPFHKGKSFLLQFVITKNGYRVIVDNKPFYEYSHRIPIEQVKILQVAGAVELQQIEIFKDSNISSSTSPEAK